MPPPRPHIAEAGAHFLAGSEIRHALGVDRDDLAGTRVATGNAHRARRKRAEPAQFDTTVAGEPLEISSKNVLTTA